jgi:hypothetical protein
MSTEQLLGGASTNALLVMLRRDPNGLADLYCSPMASKQLDEFMVLNLHAI